MKHLYLSVIIPCYDEMANLQKGVLDKVNHFLRKKKFTYEIIIVDDGSSDGSTEFIEHFIKDNSHIVLYKNHHTGKAGAVTKGVLAAQGQYILFTDMDQATPIEDIDMLLPYFGKKYDVVIGSRKDRRNGSPWSRLLMSRVWMILRNLTIGLGIEDTQCGFKMFTNQAAKKIFEKINEVHNGFTVISGSSVSAGFDVEILYLAERLGYKIKEVAVQWLYVETRRVNTIKDSFEGLQQLIKIKINTTKKIY